MKKTLTIVLSTLTMVALSSATYAWVEPDQMPPNGNIAAPLNTGSLAQSKIGGLIISIGNAAYGLIVKNGNSGFGTETPTERVDVNGNIKLNGKIIGLQAPTDANDAVNKGYVDAMGGGGSYETVWGTTDCAPGDFKIYDGYATVSLTKQWGYGTAGGGGIICKKGELYMLNTSSIVAMWSQGFSSANPNPGYTSGDAIECALCKTK